MVTMCDIRTVPPVEGERDEQLALCVVSAFRDVGVEAGGHVLVVDLGRR
jgi:hypothetical protein